MPGVAREIKKNEIKKSTVEEYEKFKFFSVYGTPRVPMGSLEIVSQFGPAGWPAIADIYVNKQIALLKR